MDNQDAKKVYTDIIDLPHHQSNTRPHMSMYDRAAQFAPFAALVGYDEMIVEEGRLTDSRIQLTEAEIEILDHKLELISAAVEGGGHPAVTFTYFLPDLRKTGGSYETVTGKVKRVDRFKKALILYGSEDIEDRRAQTADIPFDAIVDITGGMFGYEE